LLQGEAFVGALPNEFANSCSLDMNGEFSQLHFEQWQISDIESWKHDWTDFWFSLVIQNSSRRF
jgi:hypothetical protein